MMRKAMVGGWVAAVLMLPGLGVAQPRPVLEDPDGTIVEELVVQAREPGPAWWKVSDADTTVYILGVTEEHLPKGLNWDQRYLQRRLKGANSLIIGTRVSLKAKVSDVPALLKARGKLKSKAPMESTLPEPLRARFVAARERIGQPASRYAGWGPLMAGQQLLADTGKGEQGPSMLGAILKQARAEKVKVVDPARYEAMPFIRAALESLTPAVHQQCLEGALTDAEAPKGRVRAAAEGWARGDVAAALREPRSFEKCLLLLGGGADLWRRMTGDQAAAIAAALDQPGHSVAIVSLRPLLAQGGVAQQLEARGVEVVGPGG
jgi:uncharacterized protein YbaP (TraB family)